MQARVGLYDRERKPKMKTGTSKRIRLHDGRTLGFLEVGDLRGRPIFYFHGFPGSRLEARFAQATAERQGVRVIGVDRPGFGLSQVKPGRTIDDWPDDVLQLAAAIGTKRFAVLGASGGGPYAVACAAKIPDHLTAAGILCGLGPIQALNDTANMMRINRIGLLLARHFPWATRPIFAIAALGLRHFPDRIVRQIASRAPDPDKEALATSTLGLVLRDSFWESVGHSLHGPAEDLILYGRPWGFRLQEITSRVYVWHGEKDRIVPCSIGRYLAQSIPGCRAIFYPEDGHFSIFLNHLPEILATLAGDPIL
jgi:pimeloyl-ACP methyl ester carboxylesterase